MNKSARLLCDAVPGPIFYLTVNGSTSRDWWPWSASLTIGLKPIVRDEKVPSDTAYINPTNNLHI